MITEHIFKYRKGIDDLKSLYAFHGNSQGDETQSNDIKAYLSSGGWWTFRFDCELTQEAIYREIDKRKQWNLDYIKRLMKSGEYGKEVEGKLSMHHNPEFDNPQNRVNTSYPLESYHFMILDASK